MKKKVRTHRMHVLAGVILLEVGIIAGQVLTSTSPGVAYLRDSFLLKPAEQIKRPVRKRVVPVIKKQSRRTLRQETTSKSSAAFSRAAAQYEKSRCGDKLIVEPEVCDDGNALSGDGCSATCLVETGYACTSSQPSTCISTCGDGVVASNEKCDDSNVTAGDGCSATCKPEFGYTCAGTPSTCKTLPYCGNGITESPETCDDGNRNNFDGCSGLCVLE